MKATPKLSYLSDIKPYKPEWWVQVKVLHTWKQNSKFGETMEIIFADKKVNDFDLLCLYNIQYFQTVNKLRLNIFYL